MQSDERINLAIQTLSGSAASFRSAVAAAAEQVRSYVSKHSNSDEGPTRRLGAELGAFADGRIDVERLSQVLSEEVTLDPPSLRTFEEALNTLSEVAAAKNESYVIDVPPRSSLYEAVSHALAQFGRAFEAARLVEQCKTNGTRVSEQAASLGPYPFRRWNRAQRRLAPPLIVHVDGGDLHAAGLAEFLDGSQKFVLVVRGNCPAAPLVRLITPGTFVLQTTDQSRLDRLAAWDGPGVAALVSEGAATFIHDPTGGSHLSERLTVTHLPEEKPQKALGSVSASQQVEDLEQLRTLATQPAEGQTAGERSAARASDPVDKLASWLISQAKLD